MRSIMAGQCVDFTSPRRYPGLVGAVFFAVSAMAVGPAFAQDGTTTALAQAQALTRTGEVAAASFSVLMILFVLAILIESALAVIFNWRLFLEMFNGRGVKTLVAIVLSAIVVSTFNLDQQVFGALLEAYGVDVGDTDHTVALIVTTLILAGGSSGVNRILVSLGYRQPVANAPKVPKAPKGKAWVAIRVTRDEAAGPIEIHIQKKGPRTDQSPPELAGVIAPVGFWYRLWSVFFLDRSRYPPTAGHEVLPGHEYAILVEARKQGGEPIDCDLNDKTYCFADGAIIDFHVAM